MAIRKEKKEENLLKKRREVLPALALTSFAADSTRGPPMRVRYTRLRPPQPAAAAGRPRSGPAKASQAPPSLRRAGPRPPARRSPGLG